MPLLQYSYITGPSSILPPDEGFGLYAGKVDPSEYPKYIKPETQEYMKHFGVSWQYPGYTRIGNNTLNENIDNRLGINCLRP